MPDSIVNFNRENYEYPQDTKISFTTVLGTINFEEGDTIVNENTLEVLLQNKGFVSRQKSGVITIATTAENSPNVLPTASPDAVSTTSNPSPLIAPTALSDGSETPIPTDLNQPDTSGTAPKTGKLDTPAIMDVAATVEENGYRVDVTFDPVQGAKSYRLQYAQTSKSSYTTAGEEYKDSPITFTAPSDFKSVIVRLTALGDGVNTTNSDADVSSTITF